MLILVTASAGAGAWRRNLLALPDIVYQFPCERFFGVYQRAQAMDFFQIIHPSAAMQAASRQQEIYDVIYRTIEK